MTGPLDSVHANIVACPLTAWKPRGTQGGTYSRNVGLCPEALKTAIHPTGLEPVTLSSEGRTAIVDGWNLTLASRVLSMDCGGTRSCLCHDKAVSTADQGRWNAPRNVLKKRELMRPRLRPKLFEGPAGGMRI